MTTVTRDNQLADPSTEAGFRRLWITYAPELRRFARRRASSAASAEDLVQEVFVRAWRHARTYDAERGAPRAWLFAILRNVIIDHARMAARRPIAVSEPAEPMVADDQDRRLARLVVARALQRLSTEHRDAIIENYYRDLPGQEIAHRAGVPLGTVRSRLHYALKALSQRLDELGYEL